MEGEKNDMSISKILRYCLIFLICASVLMIVSAIVTFVFGDSSLSLSMLILPAITVLLAINAIHAIKRSEKNQTENDE